MSIVSITTNLTGQIGVKPRRVALVTTDSLSAISALGWANANLIGYTLEPTDVIDAWYGTDSFGNGGAFGIFNPYFVGNQIILIPWVNPANVLLPVVNGGIAFFSGDTGQIQDIGVSPSNVTYPKVASVDDAATGSIAFFSDNNGTITQNPGTLIASQTTYEGGASTFTVPAIGITASHNVIVQKMSSANSTSVINAFSGPDIISLTLTGDPGSSTYSYIGMKNT